MQRVISPIGYIGAAIFEAFLVTSFWFNDVTFVATLRLTVCSLLRIYANDKIPWHK
jgi:hypothetical protein